MTTTTKIINNSLVHLSNIIFENESNLKIITSIEFFLSSLEENKSAQLHLLWKTELIIDKKKRDYLIQIDNLIKYKKDLGLNLQNKLEEISLLDKATRLDLVSKWIIDIYSKIKVIKERENQVIDTKYIYELIETNKLKESIEFIKKKYPEKKDDLTLIKARLEKIETDEIKGIIDPNYSTVEYNKIRHDLLNLTKRAKKLT